ncbi:MAG: IS21 family transposase, partial [Syntrophorhabdaceae bacterium]|nr:IS21 family transposase [Syntrophorhabdaceae bacterium]
DKAKVGSAVLIAERRILAALRNHTFFSIGEQLFPLDPKRSLRDDRLPDKGDKKGWNGMLTRLPERRIMES